MANATEPEKYEVLEKIGMAKSSWYHRKLLALNLHQVMDHLGLLEKSRDIRMVL